jgi:uncharacterized membrane protein SpoIIM required for sporulation
MGAVREEDRQAWHRLTFLLDRIDQRGPRGMSADQLWEMGRLYRRVTTDLARAKTEGKDEDLIGFLNSLSVRAHGQVYRTRAAPRGRIWPFLSTEFPRRVREGLPYSGAALAICTLASLAAFASVLHRPEAASAFIPETLRRHLESRMGGEEIGETSLPFSLSPVLSSAILFNNVRVAVLAFGLGITAGLGTVYVLVQNGLMLGALAGMAEAQGVGVPFWALILPHGVIELAAIFISAGAGLRIARAVVAPGELCRREAIIVAARQAIPLVLGAVPMLVVAAFIEGFLTPAPVPAELKLAFGVLTFLLLVGYFTLAGRGRASE